MNNLRVFLLLSNLHKLQMYINYFGKPDFSSGYFGITTYHLPQTTSCFKKTSS